MRVIKKISFHGILLIYAAIADRLAGLNRIKKAGYRDMRKRAKPISAGTDSRKAGCSKSTNDY